MLIEGAFYKLSDYFQSIESPGELYEAQVSFIFAVAIFQEFQVRGFPYLLPYIQLERQYPERDKKVDIYVKIPKEKLPHELLHRWANSGVCEENWIEVKFFGGAERKDSTEAKSQNLGNILSDLLRLKYYVREGGKYLLLVFNRKPEYYLPIKRKREERSYVDDLLRFGIKTVKIDFDKEVDTVINTISKSDEELGKIIREKKIIELNVQTHCIEPILVRGLLMPSHQETYDLK